MSADTEVKDYSPIQMKKAQEKRLMNYEKEKENMEVEKVEGGYLVKNINKNSLYSITKEDGRVMCDCPDFVNRCLEMGINCKHIIAVYRAIKKNNTECDDEVKEKNSNHKFEPQKHLIKVKGQDYLEVKFRLHWCRQDHPDWDINPVTTRLDIEKGVAVARCDVYDATGKHLGAGEKMEERKTFYDYLEKAHTGAVGRALATVGYGTLACGGEMDEGVDMGRIVDAPANISNTEKQVEGGNGKATSKQIEFINDLCRQMSLPLLQPSNELTKERASQYIEELQKELILRRKKQSNGKSSGGNGRGNKKNSAEIQNEITDIINRW